MKLIFVSDHKNCVLRCSSMCESFFQCLTLMLGLIFWSRMFAEKLCIIYDTMDHFQEKLLRKVSWHILVSGMIEVLNLILGSMVMNP